MTARWILTVLTVAAGAAFALSSLRLVNSQHAADQAKRQLATINAELQSIRLLRAERDRHAVTDVPIHDLIAHVSDTLAHAGLDDEVLRTISPESRAELLAADGDAPPVFQQTVRITLDRLAPTDVGQFLDRWRRTHAPWRIGRIDLTHSNRTAQGHFYDVTVLVGAISVEDA